MPQVIAVSVHRDLEGCSLPSPVMKRLLSLRNTKVTDAGMEHLAGLTALTSLDAIETRISSIGFRHLSRSPLESFGFGMKTSDPDYLAEIPRAAAIFPKLNRFLTTMGQVGAAHVQAIGKAWPGITKLSVPSFTTFDDGTFAELQLYLPKVNTLDLWASKVADNHIAVIAQDRQISHLFIHDTPVTDLSLPHLEKMRSLKQVDLTNTLTTEQAVAVLRKARPDLKIAR